MDLEPTTDQHALIDVVTALFAKQLPHNTVQKVADGGAFDAELWRRAGALGLFSLGLPDTANGADAPVVEEALAFRAVGAHLAPVEFIASVLAARIAHHHGRADLRDDIATGGQTVALALSDGEDVLVPPGAQLVVQASATSVRLTEGVRFDDVEVIDGLDPLSRLVRMPMPPATMSMSGTDARALFLLGTLLAAAMAVGVATAATTQAVSYAKDRVQFGRPIGVNQAIKHACADSAVRGEAASAQLLLAALSLRDGLSDARFQVAAAKEVAIDAAYRASRSNIQIHGGIGFTWEHPAHLLLARTHVLDQLFGNQFAQEAVLLADAAVIA